MLVKNAMSRGKLFTLSPGDTFEYIIKFLIKHKISGAPVLNKKEKVVGIVSEKDLFFKLYPSEKVFYKDPKYYMNYDRIEAEATKIKKLKARDFMSRDVIKISPDDHVLKACSLFIKNKVRRLPVIAKGKLIGIVTTNDVYKRFLLVLLEKK